MLERFRSLQGTILRPVAGWLVGLGVPPDAVTWFGTVTVTLAALVCFPNGWLWQGALLVGLCSVSDMLDGHMARALPGRDRRWGSFLDSTLDRVADAGILGGLAWFLVLRSGVWWAALAILALVAAQLTSYVKARAEAVGASADVGVVTRADRVAIAVLGALLGGLGVPWAVEAAVLVLAVGGTVTVGQRLVTVRAQLRA